VYPQDPAAGPARLSLKRHPDLFGHADGSAILGIDQRDDAQQSQSPDRE
jgi:hypothetical protein